MSPNVAADAFNGNAARIRHSVLLTDVSTGETPWLKEMIEKYDKTARSNGAIVGHGSPTASYVFV
jgi:hypothetical protein